MEITVFLVQKFFPPRCPKCEHAFSAPEDFAQYAGGGDTSFVEAKIRQAKLFPELFASASDATPGVHGFSNKFGTDFILCRHCENVTLRIEYASRQVMTREEAIRLVTSEGFTCWFEGTAVGTMARPYFSLSILGTAEIGRLSAFVVDAKRRAAEVGGEQERADAFTTAIDPALVEIVNKVREHRLTAKAAEGLRAMFGSLWENLVPESRDFLLTAEVLKDDLISLTETNPSIDFSPAVATYSKALEKDLLEKLFRPFLTSSNTSTLPKGGTNREVTRSIETLRRFLGGGPDPSLGDMAFSLLNLGCRLRGAEENGFARFLRQQVVSPDAFCDVSRFPQRLIEYVGEYRNKSAHVAKLSKAACLAARAFLLEEPVRLLILLEESLRGNEERPNQRGGADPWGSGLLLACVRGRGPLTRRSFRLRSPPIHRGVGKPWSRRPRYRP